MLWFPKPARFTTPPLPEYARKNYSSPNKISTGLESLETMENSSRREGLSNNIRHIKSGYESRKAFMSENDNKYKKKGKSAT